MNTAVNTADMRRARVDLAERGYDVLIGPGAHRLVGGVLTGRTRVAVVSQEGVARHWGERVTESLEAAGAKVAMFMMADGEEAKCHKTVETLCGELAEWGLLRTDALVALGGGVVGDTAGFVAATYHRGIAWVQAPTTLLAQVDAAIGGKTGVNLPEGKNLVGAFHQPLAVLADIETLATLPEREYRAGFGEVAKYAFLGDLALWELLEGGSGVGGSLETRDPAVLAAVVERSATAKATVVAADEFERTGLRATLNYGHTLAHALETVGGYGLLHGEAVAIGAMFAAHLAHELGRIDAARVEAHNRLLVALGLPTMAPAGVTGATALDVMLRDKKRGDAKKTGHGLVFMLDGPEGVELVADPDRKAVESALAAVGVQG